MAQVLRSTPPSSGSVTLPLAASRMRQDAPAASRAAIDPTSMVTTMAAVAVDAIVPKITGNPLAFEEAHPAAIDPVEVERAYAEARERAETEVRAEWNEKLDQLASLLDSLHQAKVALGRQIENDAAAIGYEAVIRIVGQRATSRQVIANVVNELLDSSEHRGSLMLRVGTEDYELLLAEPVIADLEDVQARIKLVEDPRVRLGGCIVETERGTLDARLETQLDRLKQALLSASAQADEIA